MTHRLPAALLGALLALALLASQASAYWSGYGSSLPGVASAQAAALGPGATPGAGRVGSTNDVKVEWTASALSAGPAATGYTVTRYARGSSTAVPATGGCAGRIASLTCTEATVPAGEWEYTVTPWYGAAWRGAESPRGAVVTTAPPSVAVQPTVVGGPAARLPATMTGTIAGFPASAAITYKLDGTTVSGAPAAVDAHGQAAITALTIPAGTADGTHTLTVSGGGTEASATILVDSTAPTGGKAVAVGLGGTGNQYAQSGSVTIELASGTDPVSGLSPNGRKMQRAVGTLSGGTCSGYGSYQTVATSPVGIIEEELPSGEVVGSYQGEVPSGEACYRFRYVVFDKAGNEAQYTTADIKVDRSPPSGGSVTYPDGAQTATAPTIAFTPGTDAASGILAGSGILQRASATLSGETCGSFGGFETVATNPESPYTSAALTVGRCYQWRYLVSDNAGGQTVYTSPAVYKLMLATTTALTSSAATANFNASVTYRATVTPKPGGGTVAFTDNGNSISGCTAVAVSASNGRATCTVALSGAIVHTVKATFSGGGGYKGSESSAVTVLEMGTQQARSGASDAAAGDRLGTSVSISSDGNTAVVGAPAKNLSTGSAYVFTRSGTTWSQQAKLTASDAAIADEFGWAVAVSGEGTTAIIGARGKILTGGAAYVFTRSGTTWSQQAKLTASDAALGDRFGSSVSVSDDGATALVGAPAKSSSTGAAYVFTRSGTTWSQQAKLTAADGTTSSSFGESVGLAGEGSTAVIGAPAKSSSTGAAYVFTRSGTTWSQQAKLTAADAAAGDLLGQSVAASTVGDTVLVGAGGKGSSAGAAYVFTRSGTTWSQQAKLTASDAAANNFFGYSVALSSDGATALVGSYGSSTQAGAAYVFTLSGSVWTQRQKLTASDATSNYNFGWAVAIADTGPTVVVGSRGWNGNIGAMYSFAW